MASILDMKRSQIDEYLVRNEAAVRRILSGHSITGVHVNHVILMAVVVHRICSELGIPFGVMPHGSAIEYVVKHDEEMKAYAEAALADADRIFILSDEMRERIQTVFGGLKHPDSKMVTASAGVDTSQFRVVSRGDRGPNIDLLKQELAGTPRGKAPDAQHLLSSRLHDDMTLSELIDVLRETGDHPPKLPDVDLEAKLDLVDWKRDDVMTFVGKIIGYKGVASIIAAFPSIAARRPNARLLIAGRGNLREGLEALVWALGHGKRNLVENIVAWGGALEGEAAEPFDRVAAYMEQLASTGKIDTYFEAAREFAHPDRIIFTGYMEHDLLSHLFPCCDIAVFPSIVKEAAPLVVPEAMASGCFPMGTDFAGMGASLDAASEAVPDEVGRLMRIRPEPQHTIIDIVEHVSEVLEITDTHRDALRDLAVRKYDWRSVAGSLAREMRAMRRLPETYPGVNRNYE
jgi:glycosyltransferase involved in cell wall biosynthesis